ncbi:MAG: hypothetical protein R3C18_22130 [Planctomycetaceae bacterium]
MANELSHALFFDGTSTRSSRAAKTATILTFPQKTAKRRFLPLGPAVRPETVSRRGWDYHNPLFHAGMRCSTVLLVW